MAVDEHECGEGGPGFSSSDWALMGTMQGSEQRNDAMCVHVCVLKYK